MAFRYLIPTLGSMLIIAVGAWAQTPGTPPADAGAQTAPSCTDSMQPKAVENPKVSIVLDPKVAWQPRGGIANFTVNGNSASLYDVNVLVCFGWPADEWKDTKLPYAGRVWLAWAYRTGLWMVPLATMRIIAYGGVATPSVDVQSYIGITSPLLALLLGVLAVAIALGVFYVFARNRGVPGKGLVLWMISTRNGVASLSQAQVVLWTLLIGASAVYVMALSGVLIDVPNSTLVLLGITGIATIGAKLQNSQQDAEGTTQAENKTAPPGNVLSLLQVGSATDSEVRLAWAPPTTGGPVTHYMVQYQPTPAAGASPNPVWSADSETVVRPHHTVFGLAPATNYSFRVFAVNAGGLISEPADIGPIQTQAQAAPPAGAPGPVGGLRVAGAPTMTSAKLAWSPADGAPTGYAVQYRRHDTIEAWTLVPQHPAQPECTVDRLTSGVAYDFRVSAINAMGQGLWSGVVTAQMLRNPQWADLVVIGDGRGVIDVTRAQMLFFTLVAAAFVGLKVLTSHIVPDIPQGILLLMGISNGVYIASKFIPDR
jgi:hypothetical protein